MTFWEDNDTYALPGHTMVRPGGIGEAKEAYEAAASCCRDRKKGRRL